MSASIDAVETKQDQTKDWFFQSLVSGQQIIQERERGGGGGK